MDIKQIRMEHLLTLAEMAEKLDSSIISVFNWEQGKTVMSFKKRRKCIEVFGIDPLNPEYKHDIQSVETKEQS